MTRQYFATELSELQAEITRLQQDLDDARTGWESAVEEVREQDEKIVRLTAELEQAHNQIKFMHDYEESTLRLSDSYKQRAEAAEQQVAVLVKTVERLASMECFVVSRFVDHRRDEELLARIDYAREALSALPDRAKKIQAVVEAAKHHEQIWRQKSDQGDQIKCGCDICQAIRNLES